MSEDVTLVGWAQWQTEAASAELRWKDGKLEQKWLITSFGQWQPGVADGTTEEWREVPTA